MENVPISDITSRATPSLELASLPIELVRLIASFVRKADLPALVLASKCLYEIGTPHLYASIALHSPTAALTLANTLIAPPPIVRDPLVEMVQFLTLEWTCFPFSNNRLQRALTSVIPSMKNIRHFRCPEIEHVDFNHFLVALVSHPHPHLERIELAFSSFDWNAPTSESVLSVEDISRNAPSLRAVNLTVPYHLGSHDVDVVHKLLRASAPSLHSLTLRVHQEELFERMFPGGTAFPALRSLGLEEVTGATHPLMLAAMGHVRSLALSSYGRYMYEQLSIPEAAYPALEEISCSVIQLPALLPERVPAAHRRPVHTVVLNEARHERNGVALQEEAPPLAGVEDDFGHLQYSAVPIRDLRFVVERLDLGALLRTVGTLGHLEKLLMMFEVEPTRDELFELGPELLVRLPRLETLLMPDATQRRADWRVCCWFARDVGLQRELLAVYERCAPGLRLVAFTNEFEWEKGADGAWYTTEHVDAEVQEGLSACVSS